MNNTKNSIKHKKKTKLKKLPKKVESSEPSPINKSVRYSLYTFIGILVLIGLGYAGTTLSNSNSGYLVSDNITVNNTGIFYGGAKSFTKTADVVVCRGTSPADDLIKSFECDVVCKSTDGDCSNEIQLGDGKNIILRGEYFPSNTTITFNNFTSIKGDNYITNLNFTSYRNTEYTQIIALNGLELQSLKITSQISDCSISCSKFSVIKILNYNDTDRVSSIKDSYFSEVALIIGYTSDLNKRKDFPILIDNNVFNYSVASIQLVNVDGASITNNHIYNSWDSSIALLCSNKNFIYNNFIYHNFAGEAIELNNDVSCTDVSGTNQINTNTIYMNGISSRYAIDEEGRGNNNKITNNIIYSNLTSSNGGIRIKYNYDQVENNKIYNMKLNGILVISDVDNITGVILHHNILRNINSSNGMILIQSETNKIDNLSVTNNEMYGSIGLNLFSTNANARISNSQFINNIISANNYCIWNQNAGLNTINSSFIDTICLNSKDINGLTNSNYINDYIYSGSLPNCSSTDISYLKEARNSTNNYFCNGTWVVSSITTPIINSNGASFENLSIYYTANKNSLDYSGNGNNANLSGTTYKTNSKYGSSFSFDGANDRVIMPPIGDLTNFTVMMWINDTSSVNSMILTGLSVGDSYLRCGANGHLNLQYYNGTGGYYVETNGNLNCKNGNKFIAFTMNNNSQICFYIDGQLDSCQVSVPNPRFLASTKFILGTYDTGGGRSDDFNGTIDNFMLFNRVLSDSSIKSYYETNIESTSNNAYHLKGQDINPITNIIYNLGSSTLRWLKLWVKDIDVSGNITMSNNDTICMNVNCANYLKFNGTCIRAYGTNQIGGCL